MRMSGVGLAVVGMLALMMALAPGGVLANDNGTPTVTTDKLNYQPEETVYINGTGFSSSTTVNITVTRPDGNESSWDVSTDSNGAFSTTYVLDGIKGKYLVLATDGTHEATTFFYDGSRTFDQCKNDTDDDDEKDPCVWINGDIHSGISAYTEGDSVAYRVWMDALLHDTTHTIKIRYDFTKKTSGGFIGLGFDFLTDPDWSEDATSQRCEDIPGPIGGLSASECAGMSQDSEDINSDGFTFSGLTGQNAPLNGQSVSARELPQADRIFVIYGAEITADSAISKVGDPEDDSSSQSEVTITFKVKTGADAACEENQEDDDDDDENCRVNLLFGGHLAKGTSDPGGWGTNRGASDFPGSSLSMRLHKIDGDSSGALNRSIQPDSVIPPGTIKIIKDAIPNDPENFEFDPSWDSTNFFLDDDSDGALPNMRSFDLVFGTYTVTELGPPSPWKLTDISCTDPSGGTSDSGSTATIGLASAETVECKFTNTKAAVIKVDKVTDPSGDSQLFGFNVSWIGSDPDFSLPDGTPVFNSGDLDPGTYYVNETTLAGWDLDLIGCVRTGGSTSTFAIGRFANFLFVNGGSDAFDAGDTAVKIVLAAGETVTCTWTNEEDAVIKVDKVTDPSGDSQLFGFNVSWIGSDPDFSLADGTPVFNSGDLDPGTYYVNETTLAGWDLDLIGCVRTGGSTSTFAIGRFANFLFVNGGSDAFDAGDTAVKIVLAAGETVTCTWTNEEDAVIKVDKVTDPSGDSQLFGFNVSWIGSDPDFSLADGTPVFNSGDLDPGTYYVNETTLAGWDLDLIGCVRTGGSTSTFAIGRFVGGVFQNGGSDAFDAGDTAVKIVLAAGETVTCTWTNEEDAVIKVDKVTDPSGDSQLFGFNVSWIGSDPDFSLADGTPVFNSGDLDPGTYYVNETALAGWDLDLIGCVRTGGSTSTFAIGRFVGGVFQNGGSDAFDAGDTAVKIVLAAGETVTCTWTDEEDAVIKVDKVTDPSGDSQLFGFNVSWIGSDPDFSLADGTPVFNSGDLDPGTYYVNETVLAGWDLDLIGCVRTGGSTSTFAIGRFANFLFVNGPTSGFDPLHTPVKITL